MTRDQPTLSPQDTLMGDTSRDTMGGRGAAREGLAHLEGERRRLCSRAGKRGLTVCRSFFRPSATWCLALFLPASGLAGPRG